MKYRISIWAIAGFLVAGFWTPISLYETLAATALTYALVGLVVETLRKQFHHGAPIQKHI